MAHRLRPKIAILALIAAAGSPGCSSSKSIEMLEPGVYSVDCSGGAPTWARCHSLAEKACGGRAFEINSEFSNAGSASVGTNDWSSEGSVITRSMVIACK